MSAILNSKTYACMAPKTFRFNVFSAELQITSASKNDEKYHPRSKLHNFLQLYEPIDLEAAKGRSYLNH